MTDSAVLEAPAAFPTDPDAPLGPLSLSLSGGGYRAAGFHLGVVGLLDDVGLIRNVTSLSTVSGGTIFGAAWVVSMLDGVKFEAFREWFRDWMLKTNVVREALAGLAASQGGASRARASLIRSAARVYAAPGFLGDRKFGEVMVGSGIPAEVIFNSTEFRSGVAFRFRRSPNPDTRVGNGNFIVPREVAEQVRLADVVAASSCFPGGFEPICFPDEFEWGPGGLERAREALGEKFVPALPLMDGGVYDNQGVGSSVLANRLGEAATLLISDTNTRQEALYTTPEAPRRGWLTLNGAAWVGRILFALAVASIVALGVHAWREKDNGGWQWQDILVYIIPGAFCLAGAAALAKVRQVSLDIGVRLRERVQIARAWDDVRRLTIPEVVSLVELRATSLLSLTSNVFMKRVRELVLGSVYTNDRYKQRRAPVLLYQLDEPNTKLYHDVPWLRPSGKLVAQVRSVDTMSTTLWFDSKDQLDTLERVGAATAAFALLKLIVERDGPDGGAPGTPVRALFDRLRARWDTYNA
ncbi:MAG TPA: patatin-like phospholipase family protein [Longimicrobium sp.]|jgi:predicted acylesterase/phospholipase RssA